MRALVFSRRCSASTRVMCWPQRLQRSSARRCVHGLAHDFVTACTMYF